jgi:uncharacterized membrane protein YbaN (DUF454 family)
MKKRITHPHPVWRAIRLVAGILLLLLGLIGGLLPVVQGWIFVIPALLLLAPESRIVRKIVVRMRTRLKLRKTRRQREKAAGRPSGSPEESGSTGQERAS